MNSVLSLKELGIDGLPEEVVNIDALIALYDIKIDQYKLLNRWIDDNKSANDLFKYCELSSMMYGCIKMLEYDIKIALGDDGNELDYWS